MAWMQKALQAGFVRGRADLAKKIRLDVYLVERGFAADVKAAQALVLAGLVYNKEVRLDTAGHMVGDKDVIEVREKGLRYVSRGGLKLEKAMQVFSVSLAGKAAMDIGASTGGFTDCMLQNGADRVFSVDVGYGQLAWKLRSDPRVVNMERTNIRFVTEDMLGCRPTFASIDVSFISLGLVFPVLRAILADGADVVALIKPQFEAEKSQVETKGIVTDPSVHESVILRVLSFAKENGMGVRGLDFSPVKGPEGNIEYLVHLQIGAEDMAVDAAAVVAAAHETLNQ